jgi:tetratricopeptide (TPR) repeat protein
MVHVSSSNSDRQSQDNAISPLTSISGGVDVSAKRVGVGGDVVGRDKTTDQSVHIENVTKSAIAIGAKARATLHIHEAPAPVVTALHQLKPPPSDFLGREAELATLTSTLSEGKTNIVVLHGLGGSGKTALALKLAEQVAPAYPDAQFYVDLQGLTQPLLATEVMSRVIRAYYPTSKLPDKEAELNGQYLSVLHNRRALLLLDNAANEEQVIPLIPPAGCAMIVTSRQRFVLPGQLVRHLEELSAHEARHLLLQIAPRIGDRADKIARLCGNLPLALRLAGSTLAGHPDLDLAEYAQRLADNRKRLELVEASVSLSCDLLSAELQRYWYELAIFTAPFGRAAAALEVSLKSVAEALSEFIRYSLLEWNEVDQTYHLHDLVRLFAGTHLGRIEKQAAHRRVGHYYSHDQRQRYLLDAIFHLQRGGEYEEAAQLATSNTSVIMGRRQSPTMRSLLEQFKAGQLSKPQTIAVNISLGQIYALLGEEQKARIRFRRAIAQAATLSRSSAKHLLLARAYRGIGELLEHESPLKALDSLRRGLRESAGRDPQLEADMRIKVGTILMNLEKYVAAQNSVEQGMKMLPRGPSQLRAAALLNLSEIYYRQGRARDGQQIARRALTISNQLKDDWMKLKLKINMGVNADISGSWSDALVHYQEALELAAQLGDVNHLTMLRINLGSLHMNMGDYVTANDHLQKGLDSARNHDSLKEHLVNLLCNVADLNLRQSKWQDAMPSLREAERLAKEMGLDHLLPEIYRSLAQVYLLRQESRKALILANRSVKSAEKFGDEIETGKSLRVLGRIQWTNHRPKATLVSFERSLTTLRDTEPYEAARTKVEWGRALLAADRARAMTLLREARATFEQLGAQRDRQACTLLLNG